MATEQTLHFCRLQPVLLISKLARLAAGEQPASYRQQDAGSYVFSLFHELESQCLVTYFFRALTFLKILLTRFRLVSSGAISATNFFLDDRFEV